MDPTSIKNSIRGLRSHLAKRLDSRIAIPANLEPQPGSPEQRLADLEAWNGQLVEEAAKIRKSVDNIAAKRDEWQALVTAIADPVEREAAQSLLREYFDSQDMTDIHKSAADLLLEYDSAVAKIKVISDRIAGEEEDVDPSTPHALPPDTGEGVAPGAGVTADPPQAILPARGNIPLATPLGAPGAQGQGDGAVVSSSPPHSHTLGVRAGAALGHPLSQSSRPPRPIEAPPITQGAGLSTYHATHPGGPGVGSTHFAHYSIQPGTSLLHADHLGRGSGSSGVALGMESGWTRSGMLPPPTSLPADRMSGGAGGVYGWGPYSPPPFTSQPFTQFIPGHHQAYTPQAPGYGIPWSIHHLPPSSTHPGLTPVSLPSAAPIFSTPYQPHPPHAQPLPPSGRERAPGGGIPGHYYTSLPRAEHSPPEDSGRGMNRADITGWGHGTRSYEPERAKGDDPRVKLPIFDGQIEDFLNFKGVFIDLVHSRSRSDAVKYSLLRDSLAGEAKTKISGLPSDPQCYAEALRLLDDEYGRPEKLIEALYLKLANLPASWDTLSSWKKTLDSVNGIIRQMRYAGQHVDNLSILHQIQGKFSPSIRNEADRFRAVGVQWTIDLFLAAIRESIMRREAQTETAEVVGNQRSRGGRQTPATDNRGGSAANFGASQLQDPPQPNKGPPGRAPCAFCQQNHLHKDCRKFSSPSLRRTQARESGLCFICLSSSHFAAACTRRDKECRVCGKAHHVLLCSKEIEQGTPQKRGGNAQRGRRGLGRGRGGGSGDGGRNSNRETNNSAATTVNPPDKSMEESAGVAAWNERMTATNAYVDGKRNDHTPSRGTLAIARVKVRRGQDIDELPRTSDPDKEYDAVIFFDGGADVSWVNESLAKKLDCPVIVDTILHLSTFGGGRAKKTPTKLVRIDIREQDGRWKPIEAQTVAEIGVRIPPSRLSHEDVKQLESLGHPTSDLERSETLSPDVVIGADLLFQFFKDPPKQLPSGLTAIGTTVGVVLTGKEETSHEHYREKEKALSYAVSILEPRLGSSPQLLAPFTSSSIPSPTPEISDFWAIDKIGIADDPVTSDDETALQHFNQTVYREDDGRYVVSFPWIQKPVPDRQGDNRPGAWARFQNMLRRFKMEPQLYQQYADIIRAQRDEGILEKVPQGEISSSPAFYLPHHPVVGKKLRVVFDGSARPNKSTPSLNERIYRGPIKLPDLAGILMRFQTSRFAVISDLQQAYLECALSPADRDFTRFFWSDPDSQGGGPSTDIQILRFRRLPFGIICSSWLLSAVIGRHLGNYESPLSQMLLPNLYADDQFYLADLIPPNLYKDLKGIYAAAKFNLRKFASNDPDFMSSVPPEDRLPTGPVSVLGVQWDTEADLLQVKGFDKINIESRTRRQVLSSLASPFDVTGRYLPATLAGKRFIQQTWAKNLNWDEPFDDETAEKWRNLALDLRMLKGQWISRVIPAEGELQLHVFVDSSIACYAAVSYLRADNDGAITTSFVMSKNRLLDPDKGITIPRAELLAMTIGTRLAVFVANNLHKDLSAIYLHGDSEIVLSWMKSTKQLPVFIQNRIREIRSKAEAHAITFRYVNTEDNPADLSTRGCSASDLLNNSQWWNGPGWLSQPQDLWPLKNLAEQSPSTWVEREEPGIVIDSANTANERISTAVSTPPFPESTLLDLNRFSKHHRLVRTMAYVLRFLRLKVWDRFKQQDRFPKLRLLFQPVQTAGCLVAEEIDSADLSIIRQIQRLSFPMESSQSGSRKPTDLELRFQLFMDPSGILRSKGRFGNAALPDEVRFPIILPRKSRYALLYIRRIHAELNCAGTSTTLSHLRRRFWVINGRQLVKTTVGSCLRCVVRRKAVFKLPDFPDYPVTRLEPTTGFTHTSIDLAGPLHTKGPNGREKCWLTVFTCQTFRGCHLELVQSLSSSAFLMALRRFIARKGRPRTIRSDNGTNFTSVAGMIQRFWPAHEDEEVFTYLANHSITWTFSAPFNPTANSLAEAMVKLVKRSLRAAIGQSLLQFTELHTLLVETEAIVNTRPLYQAPDSLIVRTPACWTAPGAHLGTGALDGQVAVDTTDADPEYSSTPTTADQLEGLWRKLDQKRSKLWSAFVDEYVLQLRERTQTKHHQDRSTINRDPVPGEIVLLTPPPTSFPTSPGSWPLAEVLRIEGTPGSVRVAEVRTPKAVYRRPISQLVPLEITRGSALPIPGNDTKTPSAVTGARGAVAGTAPGARTPSAALRTPTRERPRTRQSTGVLKPALYTSFFIMISLLAGTEARHPNECIKPGRILASQKCTPSGTVIHQEDRHLCWAQRTCPRGHHLTGQGRCGTECRCGSWADRCSYFTGDPEPATPEQLGVLVELGIKNFCARKKKSICAPNPVRRKVWRVMLRDQSKFYLEQLTIQWKQPSPEKYSCVGPPTGSVGGTADFCANHRCSSKAQRLCYYTEAETAELVHGDVSIPIKAYGMVDLDYFPNKLMRDDTVHDRACVNCRVTCAEEGINVAMDITTSMIKVCSGPWCTLRNQPSAEMDIWIPPDLTMKAHIVTVRFWNGGLLRRTVVVECEKTDLCLRIKCNLCLQRLKNPTCRPWWTSIILFVLIYLSASTVYTVLKLIGMVLKGLKCCASSTFKAGACGCRCLRRLIRAAYGSGAQRWKRLDEHLRRAEARRPLLLDQHRPRLLPRATNAILLISALLYGAEGCRQDITMNTQRASCTVHEGGQLECHIREGIRVGLVPNGMDTCLLIKDHENRPLGTLAIEVKNLELRCARAVRYFTRSIEMTSQSSKRCAFAGTCADGKCRKVSSPHTWIPELSDTANRSPGHSGCYASCGCVGCGCFHCSSACLFYRWFATPLTKTIYTIFDCPRYTYQLKAKARLMLQDGSTTMKELDLELGHELHWDRIHIGLVGVSDPPSPLLSTSFISNGVQTRTIHAPPAGQPQSGTVGALQCQTRKQAENLECALAPKTCDCEAHDSHVQCSCAGGNLEALFEADTPELLPLVSHGLELRVENNQVVASYADYTTAELQIEFQGFSLSAKSDANVCSVNLEPVSGCYDCARGASLRYHCSTNFGEALAHIQCRGDQYNISFSTPCSENGIDGTASISIPVPNPSASCEVACPAGTTTADLRGTLVFVGTDPMFPGHSTGNEVYNPAEDPFSLIRTAFAEWGPVKLVSTIIGSIVALIVTMILGPPLLGAFINCLRNIAGRMRRARKKD